MSLRRTNNTSRGTAVTRGGQAGAALLLLVTLAACAEPSVPSADHGRAPVTDTADPGPAPSPLGTDDSIYFAAESSAGEALTDFRGASEVETDPKQMDIYLSRPGQPVRRVIATRAHERCPVVSPDGTRLAYLEGPTVVIVPLDPDGNPGAAEARVDLRSRGLYRPDDYRPKSIAGPACPQWSPNGRRLGHLIMTGDPDTPLSSGVGAEVLAVALDAKVRVLARFDTFVWDSPHFAWSPDGGAFAYTTTDGVWRVRRGGGSPRLVWRSPEGDATQMMPMDFDRPISVTWSSRNELAFAVRSFVPTEPNNRMSGGNERWRVLVVDAGSGRTLFEAKAGSVDEAGAGESWSRDGSLLVFNGPGGRVLLHDRATGTTDRVRSRVAGSEVRWAGAKWSPDGQQLLSRARDDARGFALVSFAVDGSSSEVRTPWTWALDWVGLDDVAWGAG